VKPGSRLPDHGCERPSHLQNHHPGMVRRANHSYSSAIAFDLRLHEQWGYEYDSAVLSPGRHQHRQHHHQPVQRGGHESHHECQRSRLFGRNGWREFARTERRQHQRLYGHLQNQSAHYVAISRGQLEFTPPASYQEARWPEIPRRNGGCNFPAGLEFVLDRTNAAQGRRDDVA